jgi:tRNA(fMet)-specific endonuclease VapC
LIFLDTNVLIPILRKKGEITALLEFFADKQIGITTLTVFELYFGAFLSKKQTENLVAVKKLVRTFPIFPFTIRSSIFSSIIARNLQESGNMIELTDIFMASIVLENKGELATYNLEHFQRIEKLKLVELPGLPESGNAN